MFPKNVKRNVALFLSTTLLLVSCKVYAVTPTPGIPVTGNTALATAPATSAFPSPTPGQASALFFDGRDDYVMVKDNPSLDLQSSFTIAAWIYLTEYTEWASIVTKGDKPNLNNYAIQQSGPDDPVYGTEFGKLRFSGCLNLTAPLPESQSTLALQKWHFVAITFDGSFIRFYLNGKLDGATTVTGPLCANDKPLYIGVDLPLTTEYWHGAVDELRIWNSTLSDSQIADAMNARGAPSEGALVGYWNFDEGSGTIAHDLSGHANDGLIIGNPVWIKPGAPVQ